MSGFIAQLRALLGEGAKGNGKGEGAKGKREERARRGDQMKLQRMNLRRRWPKVMKKAMTIKVLRSQHRLVK
eukprot:1149633-Amphidinium_carterae.1